MYVYERGLLSLSEGDWEKAKCRAEVIGSLAALSTVGRSEAEEAAARLGTSRRTVYELIRRYRDGDGLVTDVAPGQSSGGKGKKRIPSEVDRIITESLKTCIYRGRNDQKQSLFGKSGCAASILVIRSRPATLSGQESVQLIRWLQQKKERGKMRRGH